MIPFFVMTAAILLARAAGWLGWPVLDDWQAATRVGLAVMFVTTGVAHFGSMREDMIRMVPSAIPAPGMMATLTGTAELLGAVGLLLPATNRVAAACLAALLVAMLPANVHASRVGQTLGGRPPTPLAIRVPMQGLWIALLIWIAV